MLYISPTLWMAGRLLVVSVQLEHMDQGMFSAVVVIVYYVCGCIFLLLSTAVLLLLVTIDVFYYFIVDFVVLYFVAFVPGKVLSGLVVQNVLFI